MESKRILVVGATSSSLINFRGDLIKKLIDNGFEVFAAAGAANFQEEIADQLKAYGATPLGYRIFRTGLNPFNDLKTIKDLKFIIKKHKIDLVFPYTIKPVIYGSIAGNACNVSVISLITGLGFTFTGLTFKSKMLQKLNEFLYKRFVSKNKVIIFQNKDDHKLFLDKKLITKSNKTAVVSGSGVNLNRFAFKENKYDENNEKVKFLFIARLIREKGIGLYIEAAEVLKKKYPSSEFHVIGSAQTSPSAIKLEQLNRLHEQKVIVYHGLQKNIAEHLTNIDVFVLPSYYREGVPRSILEALSVGLPAITTDAPGCRETVINGENGFLIKPRILPELIEKMEFFILNRAKIKEMGINSRKYAERRFDVDIINNDLLQIIKENV